MSTHKITDHDLLEELRLNGQVGCVNEVGLAILERNGQISVVLKPSEKPPPSLQASGPVERGAALATRARMES